MSCPAALPWLLSLALLACHSVRPAGEPLAGIIERNTRAVGGAQAIEAVTSIEFRLRIVEPKFAVDAVYLADRSGRMRIDVYAGGKRVYTEAFDGVAGWQMGADGKATVHPAANAAALWRGTQWPGKLFGLHELQGLGHRLEPQGRELIDGGLYDVVQLTLSDGAVTHLYLNAATSLIERRRDIRALHPDQDPTRRILEDRSNDYRPTGGVLRPWSGSQVDLQTGETLQTTRVDGVRINVPIDARLFALGALPAPG